MPWLLCLVAGEHYSSLLQDMHKTCAATYKIDICRAFDPHKCCLIQQGMFICLCRDHFIT